MPLNSIEPLIPIKPLNPKTAYFLDISGHFPDSSGHFSDHSRIFPDSSWHFPDNSRHFPDSSVRPTNRGDKGRKS